VDSSTPTIVIYGLGKHVLFYILDKDKNIISTTDYPPTVCVVGQHRDPNSDVFVSTVLLSSIPSFETCVFGSTSLADVIDRYATYAEAVRGHEDTCMRAFKDISPEPVLEHAKTKVLVPHYTNHLCRTSDCLCDFLTETPLTDRIAVTTGIAKLAITLTQLNIKLRLRNSDWRCTKHAFTHAYRSRFYFEPIGFSELMGIK
jgi:hypothetical protein